MSEIKNHAKDIIDILDSNPDRIVFERVEDNTIVRAKEFKEIVLNFAYNMKKNGINRDSCVLLETDHIRYVEATAMALAIGLLGASYTQLILSALQRKEIPITHVVSYSLRKESIETNLEIRSNVIGGNVIELIQVDELWFTRPKKYKKSDFIFEGPVSNDSPYVYKHSSGTSGKKKYVMNTYLNWWSLLNNIWKNYPNAKYANILNYSTHHQTQLRVQGNLIHNIIFLMDQNAKFIFKKEDVYVWGNINKWRNLVEHLNSTKVFNATIIANNERVNKQDVILLKKYFKHVGTAYACSEVGGRTCSKIIDNVDNHINGSVGKPVDYQEVLIKDKSGNVLGKNQVGQIWIRWKDAQATRYIDLPQEESDKVFRDGYVVLKDYGYIADNDELVLVGRESDIIYRNGKQLLLLDMESEVREIEGVKDCGFFINEYFRELNQLCLFIGIKDEYTNNRQFIVNNIITKMKHRGLDYIPSVIYYSDPPRILSNKLDRKNMINFTNNVDQYYNKIYPFDGKYNIVNKLFRIWWRV